MYVMLKWVLATSRVFHHVFSAYSCTKAPANARSAPSSPIMPDVTHLASMKPAFPSGTASPASPARSPFLNTTLPLLVDLHVDLQVLIIFTVFFTAGLLLLLALFHTFCLQTPQNGHMTNLWHLEREEATDRRSTSEIQSAGNMV